MTTAYAPLLLLSGGLSSSGPVGGVEPNPSETVWTLGVGGAVVSPSIAAGFSLTLATTLMNAGVFVPYTAGATLDAAVWPGGNEGAILTPIVSWIDPTRGTLLLSIPANQSAAIEQGKYRMQVGVTVAGVRSLAYDGHLEVTDSPGSVAATPVWCSYEDMLFLSDQLQSLQGKRGVDVTAYELQRQRATEERKRSMILGYKPEPGFVKVRQLVVDPIVGSFDVANPKAVAPSGTDLTLALNNAGGIVLEPDLREIIARHAISLVLRRQSPGSREFAAEAEWQMGIADAKWECFRAQINTVTPIVSPSPIGPISRFLVCRDEVILLPEGTSP